MKRLTGTALILLLVALCNPVAGIAGEGEGGEQLTARVVDTMGTVRGASSTRVKIRIDSYSTEQEVKDLVKVFAQQGEDALYQALRDLDQKGSLTIGNGLAQSVSVIRSRDTEDGRVLRLLLNRPISYFESVRGLRLNDYPFGFIEVTLDGDGKGEGDLYAAASIGLSEEGISISSFGVKPLRLLKVRLR